MHVKIHQSDYMISLKDAFFIWKDHYLISASLDLLRKFSIIECLKKWGLWQSCMPLKCAFSVHFNEIITQCNNIWKILSFFLDSNGANLLNFQNCRFFHTMIHPLPDFYKDWHFKEMSFKRDNIIMLIIGFTFFFSVCFSNFYFCSKCSRTQNSMEF